MVINAQSIKMVAKSNGNSIELKWFSNTLLAKEGVNLYRQSNGVWTKVNATPILKGNYTPSAAEFQADKDLKDNLQLLKATKPLESFGLLFASMQSVKSTPFARAAGLYFSENMPSGTTGYKVALIAQGKEVAFSEYIFSERDAEVPQLSAITFDQRFKKVNFTWKVEEDKFYAVNVYRSSSPDSIGKLVTLEPIIPSKVKNEAGVQGYPEWLFEDRLVAEKSTYYYRLVGLDFFNQETKFSEPIAIRIKDETVPLSPVLKTKDEEKTGFRIHWEHLEKSDDQTGYEIFLTDKNDSIFHSASALIGINETSFFVELEKVGTYSVKVASKDAEGNFGYSNEMVLDFLDKTPPAQPVNVQLNTDSTLIQVTWSRNLESDLLGYKIYRGINGEAKSMALQTSTPFAENKYEDRLPKNSKNSFSYSVVAVDSSLNESPVSIIASKRLVDVVPPKAPFIKNIESQEKGVLISWSKNTEIDLLKYEIYRKNSSDSLANFEQLNLSLLDRNSAAFLDRNFQKGKEFVYVMYALDSAGNKSKVSNEFKYFIPKDKEEIKVVCRFKEPKVIKATGAVKLTWETKPYSETAMFMVFRKTQGGAFLPLSTLLEEGKYTDQTVQKNETYAYEIRCYFPDGSFVKSEQKEISIRNKKPKK